MPRLSSLFIMAFTVGTAVAAPDEEALGKAQGYPVCPLSTGLREARCIVGQYSHLDEITTSRRIARGASTRELKSGSEPDFGVDAFMAANRNTGLLVMQGDTILAERYQYGRKGDERFTSWSMAKTVVAMLIGIAIAEKKIDSIEDLAAKYLPDLEGHPYGETSLKHLLTMSSGVKFLETDESPDIGRLVAATIYRQGNGGLDTITKFDEDRKSVV